MALVQQGQEVGQGVYRFGDGHVNWYVVEEAGALTVVDGGMPDHWPGLVHWLEQRGKTWSNVEAIVLTHGHVDHMGITRRLEEATRLPVHIHPDDDAKAKDVRLQKMPRRIKRNLWRPSVLALMASWGRAGIRAVPPIITSAAVTDGQVMDVPGRLRPVHTPGHSPGSTCFVIGDTGPLLAGDALVTLDVVTGRRGIGIMPGLLNDDPGEALASLSRLAGLRSDMVLPGHGHPYRGSLSDALRAARNAGIDWRTPSAAAHGHAHP